MPRDTESANLSLRTSSTSLNPNASEFIPASSVPSAVAVPCAEGPAAPTQIASPEGQQTTAAGISQSSPAHRNQRRAARRGKVRREIPSCGVIDDERTRAQFAASSRIRRVSDEAVAAARRDGRGRTLPGGGDAVPTTGGHHMAPPSYARQSKRTPVCGPRLRTSDGRSCVRALLTTARSTPLQRPLSLSALELFLAPKMPPLNLAVLRPLSSAECALSSRTAKRGGVDLREEKTRNDISLGFQEPGDGQTHIGESRRRHRWRSRGELPGHGGGDGGHGEGSLPSVPPRGHAFPAGGEGRPASLNNRRWVRGNRVASAVPAGSRSNSRLGAVESAEFSALRSPQEGPPSCEEHAMDQHVVVSPSPADGEKDFPGLPLASGCGTRSKPLLLNSQRGSTVVEADVLDYASVAEKLAVNAAAAEATATAETAATDTKSAGRPSGASEESIRRLIVLPGFREDRRGEMKQRVDDDESLKPEEEVLQTASLRSYGSDGGLPETKAFEGLGLPSSLPPEPEPQPTLAAGSFTSRRAGAPAATAALRNRLRERWFRLEAMKKAERQREAAERSLMRAEDDESIEREVIRGRRGVDDLMEARRDNGGRLEHNDCEDASSKEDSEGEGKSSCDDDNDEGFLGSPHTTLDDLLQRPDGTTAGNREASIIDTVRVVCSTTSGDSNSPTQDANPMSAAGAAAVKRAQAAAASTAGADASISVPSQPALDKPPKVASSSDNGKQMAEWRVADLLDASPCGEGCNGDSDSLERCDGDDVPLMTRDPVHTACKAGMAGLLNDLLVRTGGRAADGKDKLRRTPLHLAAEAGSLECVNLLLKQGTRLDQRDRWRETPLHKAARSDNADVVKALCAARMKVNVRNRHRETPLLLAVRASRAEATAVLLSFGARSDDPDVDGITPVCQAAMDGQGELLMAMANSNQACRKSSNRDATEPRIAVVAVAEQGNIGRGCSTAKRRYFALSGRPPIAATSNSGGSGGGVASHNTLSPVHEAAAAGQVETLSLLLQLGVSFEERDSAAGMVGDTPLGRAVRCGRLDCARLLLDVGAMIGRENARGETPLVIAIRAGQASAVELLVKRGASLDGGQSRGRLASADGRAPAGAREKMMARRRAAPLEVALREGQLACAAVLIEGGAHINVQALRTVKLEPVIAASNPDDSLARRPQVRYAGSASPAGDVGAGGLAALGTAASATIGGAGFTRLVALQPNLLALLSSDVRYAADTAPPGGGGLQKEEVVPGIDFSSDDLKLVETESGGSTTAKNSAPTSSAMGGWISDVSGVLEEAEAAAVERKGLGKLEYVGGRMPALGECDVVLILEDGSRLPVHSCLLAAFSGTFRDLFLHRRCCRSSEGASTRHAEESSSMELERKSTFEGAASESSRPLIAASQRSKYLRCICDVQTLLTRQESRPVPPVEHPLTVATAAAATVAVAATTASQRSTFATSIGRPKAPSVVRWGQVRGDIIVRFWGPGTVAALVTHVYSGRPPDEVPVEGLGRLLAAAVSLRMPRLTRQVEHLLSGTVTEQRGGGKSPQHGDVAKLLRGARAMGAEDLEKRCTLYLQANGGSPAVIKLRRQLGVPSLNASDVARGLARLKESGYLGSGPAHAWSSAGPVHASDPSAKAEAAKLAVDLSLRKRAVDFDQLLPLLIDPSRCNSTLSIGRQERVVLLTTALSDACRGSPTEAFFSRAERVHERRSPSSRTQEQLSLQRGCRERFCDGLREAVPLASNFAAFSHGMGWLLSTGALADVALVLPAPGDIVADLPAATLDGVNAPGGNEAVGPCEGSSLGVSSESEGKMERREAVTKERENKGRTCFLAHSAVLAARSEKFAAMLRFVRRQDDVIGQSCTKDADDDVAGYADVGNRSDHLRDRAFDSTIGEVELGGAITAGDGTLPMGDKPLLLPMRDGRTSFQSSKSRRPRHDPAPRELELHSPLLSPRSLLLFLEFLYTGVLDPGLSAGELSELALIADEYLVPDLTLQAEALLAEYLESRTVEDASHGFSSGSSFYAGQPGRSVFGRFAGDKDDSSSTPLETLQLAVSLGLRNLAVAAARAVLLRLETVSRSEAFEASGMTKRELVVAALEAARS